MNSKIAIFLILTLVVVSAVFIKLRSPDVAERKTSSMPVKGELNILWAQWKPADYLQQLTNDFTKETGIKVNIIQDSWGTWQDLFFNEMKKKSEAKFDMVIGDSQWLGRGATEGHYVELTKFFNDYKVNEQLTQASITGYSEYPKGSGHYWAVPVEGDAMGFSYRKDLFEDPNEKKKFQDKYGYELNVPKTWAQLKDIAEFFHRPENNLYGVLVWTEPKYDGITMGLDALIWAWGADLGDQKSYRVKGILNSPEGIEALKFYRELTKFSNPKWVNHYLDTNASSNQPMMDGQVAMSMGYFAINPELLDLQKNPHAQHMGFFACPTGPKLRAASLGGQGISIVSYTQNKDLAFKFLQWFIQDKTQKKWAELGGLSCNKTVLYSEEFLNASPLNRPFVESMEMVKDFWAVPEYTQLLAISQKYWYQYVIEDSITAEDAMNRIADEWEDVFETHGYYKE